MAWIAAAYTAGKMAYDKWDQNPGANLGDNSGDYSPTHTAGQKKYFEDKYSAEDEDYYNKTGIDLARNQYGTVGGKSGNGIGHDKYGRKYRENLDSWMGASAARPGLTPVQLGAASTYGGVNVGPATRINGVQDAKNAEEQRALAASLWLSAQGKGPSVAGMQMQQNTEATLAANRAAAAGVGRMNAGLANRILGQQQSTALGQAAMGSAQLKAQEAQAAQAQLGGVLSGIRAQDFGFQKANADYQHATQLAQAGFSQQGQLASMDALNRFGLAGAELGIKNQQMGLADAAQRDAAAQWYFGQRFAANQADRDAAMRAWSMARGQGNIDKQFDWQKYSADRQYDAAKQAASAQSLGWLASAFGSGSGSGGGGGGGGKGGMYDYLAGG